MNGGTVTELLEYLQRERVSLTPDGDELRCTAPPGVLTDALLGELRSRKRDLLTALRAADGIPRRSGLPPVLSYAQERMWLESALNPGDTAYNLPLRVDLAGALHPAALRQAVTEVLRRHEVLRTRYPAGRGRPRPVVEPPAAAVLPLVDLGGLAEPRRRQALRDLAVAEARRPFDLAGGPVLRHLLVRMSPVEHCLLLTRHHIASDGWSLGILLAEVGELYRATAGGESHRLPELSIQYSDFAAWQREMVDRPAASERLDGWVRRLRGATHGLDPLAGPAPHGAVGPAESVRVTLAGPSVAGLRTAARGLDTTMFTVLLAAFGAALRRVCGQDDIVVGSPVAGRTRAALEPLIGFFVSVLPLRLDLSGGPDFRELVGRTHRIVREALDDQDVPTERLIEALRPRRTLTDNPLFAASFTLQNTPWPEVRLPGVRASAAATVPVAPKFAIALTATQRAGDLDLELEFDPRRIEAATAQRILTVILTLIHDALADGGAVPAAPPGPAAPAPSGRFDAGPEPADQPAAECVHRLVDAVAARRPDAIAVSCAGAQLSYRALSARSARLAAALRARGVGPETLVGLCVEPSLDLVVAALGIVRAGGVYVPIDPADPPRRRAQVCADGRIRVAVTRRGLLEPPVDRLYIDEPAQWTTTGVARPGPRVTPGNGAYAIYTSGSTGAPKGVLVSHANLSRLIHGVATALPELAAPEVWSMTHSPAFDMSVFEMWGCLIGAGRLVVMPAGTARTPDELWRCLVEERVTVLSQTPGAFGQLAPVVLRSGTPGAGALRMVLFGGESCDVGRLRQWFVAYGGRGPALVNLYGITETTVHVTVRPLDAGDVGTSISPIGRAIPGQSAAVLDTEREPAPEGSSGELYVGGVGVARGYLNRPGLTAGRFGPDPRGLPGSRRYRSGDLAKVLPGGQLSYVGRMDEQVKLRGYRIELGEIDAVLSAHPGVRAAAVVLSAATERRFLVGYVVPEPAGPDDNGLDEVRLRQQVAQLLPAYMVPARVVFIDALPLTRNGKVDRQNLARRSVPTPGRAEDRPRTDTERALAAVLAELLGNRPVGSIGLRDNAFDLGGDSLVITQLHARIVELYRVDPPIRRVYQALDLGSLAAMVDELRTRRERDAVLSALDEIEGLAEEDVCPPS